MPEDKPEYDGELYASYLQVRTGAPKGVSAAFDERWTWIVMPSPTLDADKTFYFYRYQASKDNRARWTLLISTYDELKQAVANVLSRNVATNAEADQPIVVGVTHDETTDMLGKSTTAPWTVINRVAKVSVSAGGFIAS
jgi:hypothetical protein